MPWFANDMLSCIKIAKLRPRVSQNWFGTVWNYFSDGNFGSAWTKSDVKLLKLNSNPVPAKISAEICIFSILAFCLWQDSELIVLAHVTVEGTLYFPKFQLFLLSHCFHVHVYHFCNFLRVIMHCWIQASYVCLDYWVVQWSIGREEINMISQVSKLSIRQEHIFNIPASNENRGRG